MRAVAGLVLGGLVLAGCAVGRPAPVAQPTTPGRFAEAFAAGEPDLAAWWRGFNDPVLDDLVGRTLAANLDIAQAAARVDEARQQEVVAGARFKPQVQLAPSAGRYRISEHAIPLPPGSAPGGGTPSPFGLPGSEFDSFRLEVDAAWELDLWGGGRAGVRAAAARREAAQWSRRDLQVAMAAETARQYLELRAAQRRLAIAGAEADRQHELLAIVTSRAGAGLVSHQDVEQQAALARSADARLQPLAAQARALIHGLGVLVGESPEALISLLAPERGAPATPPAPPPGLPSQLLQRRPDVRRAELQAEAAAADVGVARADLYPQIKLTTAPSLVSTSLSSLLDWGSRSYSLSAGLLWPVIDGGRLKAQLASADARQTEALLAYRKTVLVGLQEVEDALSRYQADSERTVAAVQALAHARAAESLAGDRQAAGLTDQAPVLQARQAVIQAEDEQAQAEAARADDVVALYRALGGGWQDQDKAQGRGQG